MVAARATAENGAGGLRRVAAAVPPPAATRAPATLAEMSGTAKIQRPLVVLDPGHGGRDPGAVGSGGLRECEVTLEVAWLARELLEARGEVRVGMTRRTDVYVPLRERAEQANEAGARALVSIHCNASNGRARGIETFHFRGSERGARLARCIQTSLTEALPGVPDRGIKPAGYLVLRETRMPAALCELEFIDTAGGEGLLRSSGVRSALAHAVADGVRMWLWGAGGTADAPSTAARAAGDPRTQAEAERHPWRREALRVFYRLLEAFLMARAGR